MEEAKGVIEPDFAKSVRDFVKLQTFRSLFRSYIKNEEDLWRLTLFCVSDFVTNAWKREMLELMRMAGAFTYPLLIVAVDVRNLHGINTIFGYENGDEYLRITKEVLEGSIRTGKEHHREGERGTDWVFRWGGDEFILICSLPVNEGETPQSIERRIENLKYTREITFRTKKRPRRGQLNFSVYVACAVAGSQKDFPRAMEATFRRLSDKKIRFRRRPPK